MFHTLRDLASQIAGSGEYHDFARIPVTAWFRSCVGIAGLATFYVVGDSDAFLVLGEVFRWTAACIVQLVIIRGIDHLEKHGLI